MNGKMKRFLACVMVVVLTLTAVPLAGFPGLLATKAEAAGVWDGYYKYSIHDGEASIDNCDTEISGDVVLPGSFEGCPVTKISPYAFASCRKIESVKIPDSVRIIGASAFDFCSALKSVDFGTGVTEIGEEAFYNCGSLSEITIPKNVTKIGSGAFVSCRALASITLPDSLTEMGITVFYDTAWYEAQPYGPVYIGKFFYEYKGTMPKNTAFTVADGTKGIAGTAFFNMKNLVSVSLPDSVISIGERAFDGCAGLKSVRFGKNLAIIGKAAFSYCSSLQSVEIPEKVTQLNREVFQNCSSLMSVSLPKGLVSIGPFAFSGCKRLTGVTIPKGVTEIGDNAFNGCTGIDYIKLPDKMTSIGAGAFSRCNQLRYIHIPDGVTNVGNAAFAGCTKLTDMVIPDSVVSFGAEAFRGCTNLKTVTIGNGVTQIGAYTFYQCKNLSTIRIGKNVKAIRYYSFVEIADFPDVYYAGSEADWANITIHKSNDMLQRGKIKYGCDLSHTHSYETVIFAKATLTQDGRYAKLCKICCAEYSTGVIYKAASFSLAKTKYSCDGGVKTPAVTVKDSKGRTLKNGRDYTVTYASGRKNVGKYAVKVTLTGNYSGRTYLYFDILPGVTSKLDATGSTSAVKLTWKAVPGATGYRVFLYNTKTKKYTKLADTKALTYTAGKLQTGTNYLFAVRAYTIIGKDVIWADSFKTVLTCTKPGTPTLIAAAGAKKAALKWNKQTGATGYVVYMATSKTGKYSRVAVLKGNSAVSYTKTGLTTGRTYYFKVAAYKTVGGKNIYGGFSSVKAVKVK
ncbi:MAG: fibronectin type III domain-containing protein [Oscillospiraceae bacterium]|nr:fibronectin type III domain-containing protein [Oscillospiraceae bacterium]